MNNLVKATTTNKELNDLELNSIKDLLRLFPNLSKYLKARDTQGIALTISNQPVGTQRKFNRLLVETDRTFANSYFAFELDHRYQLSLGNLIIDKVYINQGIAHLGLRNCEVNELNVDLKVYEDVEQACDRLFYILIVFDTYIDTIRVKLKPGTEHASFKSVLKQELAENGVHVENIIIE